MEAEGWYLDPFERYEQRWFSDGTPTALVRSDGVEASDDPPSDSYPGELSPAPVPELSADDLKRADDVERNSDAVTRHDITEAATSVGMNPWAGPL